MATYRVPILAGVIASAADGGVDGAFGEEFVATSWKHSYVELADPGSNDVRFYGWFTVPQNYNSSGTTKVAAYWTANATIGDGSFEFSYKAVANGENFDPSSADQTVTGTQTTDATARDLNIIELTLTAGNLAAGDQVQYHFERRVTGDSVAALIELHELVFIYGD